MPDNTRQPLLFPKTARSRAKRLHERAKYDHASVYAVLDAAMLCHIAYVLEGQPYCTPTLHWREKDRLYWHGSSASRMLRHMTKGTPVCLTVSHLDGLVMARSGFNHSINYRSVMCFGTAHIIDDENEKSRAMNGLINRFYPGRSTMLRQTSSQESKATTIVSMCIDEAVAKIRAKGVGDDEEDYTHPVWAGIIPVHTVIGTAQPCPRLAPDIAPSSDLSPYTEGRKLDETLMEAQGIYENEQP